MDNWYLYHAVETRKRDRELVQAENYRLAKAGTEKSWFVLRTYQRIVVRMGTLLIDWGYRMQSRYDNLAVGGGTGSISKHRSSAC